MKVLFCLISWLLWNFAIFSFDKNKEDEAHRQFPLKQYVSEKWDNWVGSLICCPVLLLVMKLGFGVDVLKAINISSLQWSDALIGASGPAWEAVLWAQGKIKSYFAAKP